MRLISLLATICIFFELWHIIYYVFLYDKYFKRAETVTIWAQSYQKMYDDFMKFGDYYINNEELQQTLGITHFKVVKSVLDALNKLGTSSEARSKVLSICSMKELVSFLIQQAIEIIYWIFIVILAASMPGISGFVFFLIIMLVCEMQKRFNKDNNITYLVIDSLFCIVLYVFITFRFFNFY